MVMKGLCQHCNKDIICFYCDQINGIEYRTQKWTIFSQSVLMTKTEKSNCKEKSFSQRVLVHFAQNEEISAFPSHYQKVQMNHGPKTKGEIIGKYLYKFCVISFS